MPATKYFDFDDDEKVPTQVPERPHPVALVKVVGLKNLVGSLYLASHVRQSQKSTYWHIDCDIGFSILSGVMSLMHDII